MGEIVVQRGGMNERGQKSVERDGDKKNRLREFVREVDDSIKVE